MSDARNMEDFTKSLRSSATLLLRTLDRLQFEYSETSAREVSERVSYWPNLIGWKIARRQFQWHICATGAAPASLRKVQRRLERSRPEKSRTL